MEGPIGIATREDLGTATEGDGEDADSADVCELGRL